MEHRPLAYLDPVDPATVWNSEPGDFVPWLEAPDNLRRLGDALGLDLVPVGREVPAGRFRADFVCRDRRTDSTVVIEAQLGASDHSHLGQLLTYSEGLEADVVVWLGTRFHDEHRAVLGRLNRSIDLDLRCFAVAIDLWQIDGSPTAPQFTVLAAPGDWSRPRRSGKSAGAPAVGREPDKDPPVEPGHDVDAAGNGRRHQPRLRGAYRDRQAPGFAKDPGRHRKGAGHAARHAGRMRGAPCHGARNRRAEGDGGMIVSAAPAFGGGALRRPCRWREIRAKVLLPQFARLPFGRKISFVWTTFTVMPGLVPGIHIGQARRRVVDGRNKSGHDVSVKVCK